MKKGLISILAVIMPVLLLFMLSSCIMPTYTVTFVLGDGMDNVTTDVNSTSELYSPTYKDDSKVFGGWFLDENLTRPYLKTRITSDMTLYARFVERGEYVVTYIYDNGTPDTTYIMSGAILEPSEPHREGYAFIGWENTETGEFYEFDTVPNTSPVYLRAKWRRMNDTFTVTIDYMDGVNTPAVLKAGYGSILPPLDVPQRDGYSFLGWYVDKEGKQPYDFSLPITKDVTVNAVWVNDMADLANKAATKLLLSTVKINVEQIKYGKTGSSGVSSLGSGVIYKSEAGYYYVLTNDHVVAEKEGYDKIFYYVYDAYGNKYAASLIKTDPAYDLAVLKFAIGDEQLSVAEFADANAEVGDVLIAIGNPTGIINSVTYGKCIRYATVSVTGGSIEFPVGWHDAPTNRGSSGGAVFNNEMKVVGINFGGNTYEDGSFTVGTFIPLDKVLEFLADNKLM